MAGYESKQALIAEIEKTAALYIKEFEGIPETDRDQLMEGVDRTPAQMIAYQLGWLDLIMGWDRDEAEGKQVITPSPGFKWNNLAAFTKASTRDSPHTL